VNRAHAGHKSGTRPPVTAQGGESCPAGTREVIYIAAQTRSQSARRASAIPNRADIRNLPETGPARGLLFREPTSAVSALRREITNIPIT
jgi:hypothetical protein